MQWTSYGIRDKFCGTREQTWFSRGIRNPYPPSGPHALYELQWNQIPMRMNSSSLRILTPATTKGSALALRMEATTGSDAYVAAWMRAVRPSCDKICNLLRLSRIFQKALQLHSFLSELNTIFINFRLKLILTFCQEVWIISEPPFVMFFVKWIRFDVKSDTTKRWINEYIIQSLPENQLKICISLYSLSKTQNYTHCELKLFRIT